MTPGLLGRLGALFLAVVLLSAVVPAGGEAGAAVDTPERVVLHVQPDAPLVAVTVRFPVGHARDPEGGEGTAHLLGRVLAEEGTARLTELGGRVEHAVDVDALAITFLAPAEEWDRAWSRVRDLLTSPTLPSGALERARAGQLDRITFEEGAPVRDFERERNHLLLGDGTPGTRRPLGTASSVGNLDASGLAAWRDEHLPLSSAVVAVVGALSPRQVEAALGRVPRDVVEPLRPQAPEPADTLGAPRLPDLPSPLRPASGIEASRAWSSDRRRQVDRDVTSSWVAVAWPLPRGTSPVLTGFLAHLLREELNPVPADRDLYRSDVEVIHVDDAPVLLVTTTVHPPATLRWEVRILQAMERMAEAPPEGSFFALTRRRYRAAALLAESAPEERARALARSVAVDGRVPSPTASHVWALDRDGVSALAREAGPARVLVFGPSAMMQPVDGGSP